jgi:acetyl esterase
VPAAITSAVVLEPAAQAFADAAAVRPYLFELGPVAGRDALDEAQSGVVAKPDVEIVDTFIPVGPRRQVSVRIVRPVGATGQLPAILYMHGAGWVFGDSITHDRLVRELAVTTRSDSLPQLQPLARGAIPDGDRGGLRDADLVRRRGGRQRA